MGAYEIVQAVASEFGVSYAELTGMRRFQRIVAIRSVAAERLRAQHMSLPAIGQALGGRHHTTVMNLLGLFDKRRSLKRTPCLAGDHFCKDSVA